MSSQSDRDQPERPIKELVAIAAQRLITLTGNGPPTRSERLLQRLHLAKPHPAYSKHGHFFISKAQAGSLIAATPAGSDCGLTNKGVLIHTVTGTEPSPYGRDDDLTIFIDADVIDLDVDRGWDVLEPGTIALRLARLGRLLKYGEIVDEIPNEVQQMVICDSRRLRALPVCVLQAILLNSNFAEPHQSIVFEPQIFSTRPACTLMNIPGELHTAAHDVILRLSGNQIDVARFGNQLRLKRSVLDVNVSDINPVEQMRIVGTITNLLNDNKIDLQALNIQLSSAPCG